MPSTAPATETVACPLCGAVDTRLLYRGDGFAMGACRGCGLVRQNPRLTEAALLVDHYDGTVQGSERLLHRGSEDEPVDPWLRQPLVAYDESVSAVEAQRQRRGARGVWIDSGASTGALLVAARNTGWPVLGVEPGTKQVATCREIHGLTMVHGTFRQAHLPNAHAEVVSYRHVLEHIHDPVAELTDVRRVLADDGLLLVEVPNWRGVRYTWGRLRTALRLCRPCWERINVPEHLYYYAPATLTRLLTLAGFEPVWSTTYGKARSGRSRLRRSYERWRDRALRGNKLRVVARKR